MNLVGVETSMLPIVWPDVEKYVAMALDHNGARDYQDESRILGGLMQREMQLWVLVNEDKRFGALVTRLNRTIHGLSMEVVALGTETGAGKAHEAAIAQELRDLAREAGAAQIECHARAGLARVLANWGYESLSIHMRYTL